MLKWNSNFPFKVNTVEHCGISPFKLEKSEKWSTAGEFPWDSIYCKLQVLWIHMWCQAECVTLRRMEKAFAFCRFWWKRKAEASWYCLSQQCGCLTFTQNSTQKIPTKWFPLVLDGKSQNIFTWWVPICSQISLRWMNIKWGKWNAGLSLPVSITGPAPAHSEVPTPGENREIAGGPLCISWKMNR